MNDKLDRLSVSRRSLIRGAAQSLLGVSALSTLAPSSTYGKGMVRDASKKTGGKAKAVIYIFLTGGLSQIDSFDTKPGTEEQGPVESLATNVDGIQVSEYFPLMAKQMDSVCVIRSMNSNMGAHAQGDYYMRTSYLMNQTIRHPGIGAWGSHFLDKGNSTLPANIKIGGSSTSFGGGFLDPQHAAFPIGDPNQGLQHSQAPTSITNSQFSRRLDRVKAMNAKFAAKHTTRKTRAHVELFDEAVQLMRSKDLEGFDLTQEAKKKREAYGENTLGQGCLLAKRLIERGVRFVEVNDRGWDTHIRNFPQMAEKGAALDQALAALLEDLKQTGTLDETLVVVATEFGRTPMIDPATIGRDHHPQAFTCLLAGGGIAGGQAHGETDDTGREIVADLVSVADFNATIGFAMGLPLAEKVFSPSKRPFTVANKGEPIYDLFS